MKKSLSEIRESARYILDMGPVKRALYKIGRLERLFAETMLEMADEIERLRDKVDTEAGAAIAFEVHLRHTRAWAKRWKMAARRRAQIFKIMVVEELAQNVRVEHVAPEARDGLSGRPIDV